MEDDTRMTARLHFFSSTNLSHPLVGTIITPSITIFNEFTFTFISCNLLKFVFDLPIIMFARKICDITIEEYQKHNYDLVDWDLFVQGKVIINLN